MHLSLGGQYAQGCAGGCLFGSVLELSVPLKNRVARRWYCSLVVFDWLAKTTGRRTVSKGKVCVRLCVRLCVYEALHQQPW